MGVQGGLICPEAGLSLFGVVLLVLGIRGSLTVKPEAEARWEARWENAVRQLRVPKTLACKLALAYTIKSYVGVQGGLICPEAGLSSVT